MKSDSVDKAVHTYMRRENVKCSSTCANVRTKVIKFISAPHCGHENSLVVYFSHFFLQVFKKCVLSCKTTISRHVRKYITCFS